MNKTVYISGSITDPATGQPRDGWQKDFLEAEAKLSAMGFYVINPVDIASTVDNAFKRHFETYGGPVSSTGEPLQPKRTDYIMACLQRMQMAREADALHAVYVIGSDAEARQSIGVSMELHMATLLGIPIYGDGLAFTSFNSDCGIEIVDGEIDELMKEDRMTYREIDELMKSFGWEFCSWAGGKKVYRLNTEQLFAVFECECEIGLLAKARFIHCNMTADELKEYTRLCRRIDACETSRDETKPGEYQDAKREYKDFVERMVARGK